MPSKRFPSYRRHRPSGQAVVTLNGRDHYLGPHGTKVSRVEYDRLIAEWLSNDRTLDPGPSTNEPTIEEILAPFLRWADGYYRKNGEPTGELDAFKAAVRPLRRLYGEHLAKEFGPRALKAIISEMIKIGWARTTVNHQLSRIKRLFRWATENEMIPPSVLHGLQAVPGLRRGRSEARETDPVHPVPESSVEAALKHTSPQVSAMIRIQLLTAMRPGEVVIMRACDLEMGGATWIYRPESHKTEHHGRLREIPIGPQAQDVIRPWLRADTRAYLFSAAEAEEHRHMLQRVARQSPVQPSQRNRRKRNPSTFPRDHYDTDSYRRAIKYACEEAKIQRWHPNQLRHTSATRIRKQFGIEAARMVLGHSSAAVTEVYAEMDRTQAEKIMAQIG